MAKQWLLFILPLVCGSAWGQESSFRLMGVLISDSGRSALVNHRVAHEGDRIGDVEILAINEGAVRIHIGQREMTVRVGATVRGSDVAAMPPAPKPRISVAEPGDTARSVSSPPFAVSNLVREVEYGPVKPGDTLSAIAQRYRPANVTLNQMMVAFFEANPQAFGSNINVLQEGSVLRIPTGEVYPTAATATAEVLQHRQRWQPDTELDTKLVMGSDKHEYGPVESGDTLSGIAQRLAQDGVTLNQMMVALFEANPHAFDDNINLLYEGVSLRVPRSDELQRQIPDSATAEVMRQTASWRAAVQQPRSTIALAPSRQHHGRG